MGFGFGPWLVWYLSDISTTGSCGEAWLMSFSWSIAISHTMFSFIFFGKRLSELLLVQFLAGVADDAAFRQADGVNRDKIGRLL